MLPHVHALRFLFLLSLSACASLPVQAAAPILIKVLPQYIDRQGRHALSPSLSDRDAYQAHLRRHPEERSGIRFAIQWKGPKAVPLKLRVEMRGALGQEPTSSVLEQPVQRRGLFSSWTSVQLAGEPYKQFGELAAWRATLWEGSQQVGEQKSFLW